MDELIQQTALITSFAHVNPETGALGQTALHIPPAMYSVPCQAEVFYYCPQTALIKEFLILGML